MTPTGHNFGATSRSRAQAKAIAADSAAARSASYFALTFLMSAMFVFMLMMGWAAGY
ncbi:hypothetical protein [Hyphomicrobium sp.]|jgi:hypothetical protein|uniref:hypothetical protein n=1 Tax=Hyphomicrobium sp. TaxID=82 RepID=UPI0035697449